MKFTRRDACKLMAAAPIAHAQEPQGIDRRRLVERHNITLSSVDTSSPLTVGNGEFAFTADVTGLQTLSALYQERGNPLCTQSQWGWHSFPNTTGREPEDFRLTMLDAHGRSVGYAMSGSGQEQLYNWLRENPHRLHLGRIGFAGIIAGDLSAIQQKLDLWNGVIESRFQLRGEPVSVVACCHPELDLLAVRVESPLQLDVEFAFPYGSPHMEAADWSGNDKHRSTLSAKTGREVEILRELDGDRYQVRLAWEGDAALAQQASHRFVLHPGARQFSFVAQFTSKPSAHSLPTFAQTMNASRAHWNRFWSTGGAVDFTGSSDARAPELERRVVLSQYLTATQCAGSLPPQETGLTCNSWNGKFHLEMHWWHAAHFPLWGRTPLLEKSLAWYQSILPSARKKAEIQGYRGARWPKMTAPDGRDSPSPIGPLLIWQQPHILRFAEACWRAKQSRAVLERYRDIVFATADFMASYAFYQEKGGRYVLGPPVIPAQENHPARETWNPTFELEYWVDGLRIAIDWRQRLDLAPDPLWARVRDRLSALPAKDGVYLAHENCPQTFTERNSDHPSMLMAYGVLPGTKVDHETMRRTLRKVLDGWQWPKTWGWDFPATAMTAARLGEPDLAVAALMMETPKNAWSRNGHTWQRKDLPVYLPSNGGLLTAVAMMAAVGGFPKNWKVQAEGLHSDL